MLLTGVEHDLASNSNNAVVSMHKNLMLPESVAQSKLEAAHLPMLAFGKDSYAFGSNLLHEKAQMLLEIT